MAAAQGLVVSIRAGHVSPLKLGEDRPYDAVDFDSTESIKALEFCLQLIKKEMLSDSKKCEMLNGHLKDLVVPILTLCGEHTDSQVPWTSQAHVQLSYTVLMALKTAVNCDSVGQILLTKDSNKVLKWTMEELSPKLKDFRNNPAAQSCFIWILHHVQFPELSSHVSQFLPFSLRFIDDFETRNKICGLQCLDHIITNVNATELSWFGRKELIGDVLDKNLVAHNEVELVDKVCKCWFNLLQKTEVKNSRGRPNGWDQLAKQFLYKMEMTTEEEFRLCYSKLLFSVIGGLKDASIRWTSSILKVMTNYVEQSAADSQLRVNILKALHLLMDIHISANHSKTVLELLLRVLYDSTKGDSEIEALESCRKCFYKGARLFPEKLLFYCHGMNEVKVNEAFDETIAIAFKYANN